MMSSYRGIILTASPVEGVRPLGPYTLAHQLRINGHNTLVIDFIDLIEECKLIQLIKKYVSTETIFLGFSNSFVRIDNHEAIGRLYVSLGELAKTINPKIKIILGGSMSRMFIIKAGKTKKNLGIDYVFHGFSEYMLLEFVENEIKKIDHRSTSGISGIKEIDYDYKGNNFDFHRSSHRWNETDFIVKNESLPIEVARGCIFKCKFCAYPLLGKDPKDDSYIRMEDNIYHEIIENYEKFGTTRYFIVDDTFNERSDKIEMLLRVRDRSKINLSFVGYNRLDLIARKPYQIKLLKDLNFDGLFFGIESLNHQSAKIIGKGIHPEEVKKTLFQIKSEFPSCFIYAGFIVGLPFETRETFTEWSNWVLSAESPIDSIDANRLALTISSHTVSEFFNNPEKYGYKRRYDNPLAWENDHWNFEECTVLAKKFMDDFSKAGKQKISTFAATGLIKYGYSYESLIATNRNDLNKLDLQSKVKNFVDKYVNNLLDYESN